MRDADWNKPAMPVEVADEIAYVMGVLTAARLNDNATVASLLAERADRLANTIAVAYYLGTGSVPDHEDQETWLRSFAKHAAKALSEVGVR